MRELRHRLTRSIDATGLRRTKMAMITERSTKEPLLKVRRIGHGTLGVVDLAKSRRFYEEALGFGVLQTSRISMMIRKRSEEHTPELQSLMRHTHASACWTKTTYPQLTKHAEHS